MLAVNIAMYFTLVVYCCQILALISDGLFCWWAEIAFEKRSHRGLISNEFKFERFYRYLRYASQNSFIHLVDVFADKIVELLDEMKQEEALEWPQET